MEIESATRPWYLKPGEVIERKRLQAEFGGRTQGGIGPSKQTPNVFIFTDPLSGERHGYVDNWMPDGCFHYTGEGQRGDQRMVSGNLSILRHREEGRALRVFKGARGNVTYLDEFEVTVDQPYYETDAPETGDGPIRKVIVFRLRPRTIKPPPAQSRFAEPIAGTHTVRIPFESLVLEEIRPESQWTEKSYVDPNREPYEAERREAMLLGRLRDFLVLRNHRVHRHKILPPGEGKPLFTDLFDATTHLLVEAKGVVTREAVRMAIGQLADYARFLDNPLRVILLPSRPRDDLEALGHSQGVAFVWPTADGTFVASRDGLGFEYFLAHSGAPTKISP